MLRRASSRFAPALWRAVSFFFLRGRGGGEQNGTLFRARVVFFRVVTQPPAAVSRPVCARRSAPQMQKNSGARHCFYRPRPGHARPPRGAAWPDDRAWAVSGPSEVGLAHEKRRPRPRLCLCSDGTESLQHPPWCGRVPLPPRPPPHPWQKPHLLAYAWLTPPSPLPFNTILQGNQARDLNVSVRFFCVSSRKCAEARAMLDLRCLPHPHGPHTRRRSWSRRALPTPPHLPAAARACQQGRKRQRPEAETRTPAILTHITP
jgi:hypothetical protein